MILATFHGSSYGGVSSAHDVMTFPSIRAAAEWLRTAESAGGRWAVESTYADGSTTSDLMPAVGTGDALMCTRVGKLDADELWQAAALFVGDCYSHGDPFTLTLTSRGVRRD